MAHIFCRMSSPELCHEHVILLIKVQRVLKTRDNSLQFNILANLIGRLYKLLPERMKESLFREIRGYSNRRVVDSVRESLCDRSKQYLWQSIDAPHTLAVIYQELRRCPSVKNWTRLVSLLQTPYILS